MLGLIVIGFEPLSVRLTIKHRINMKKPVVFYARTSSKTNAKSDNNQLKDSFNRQQASVDRYIDTNNMEIVHTEYDIMTGDSALEDRAGMVRLIAYCKENSIDTIICESASRFARNKDHGIRGMYLLESIGVKSIIFADRQIDFIETWRKEGFQSVLIFLELEAADNAKKDLVKNLRAARERVKAATGKCEGRKATSEINLPLVREAKRLRRVHPVTHKRKSYRTISLELASMGHFDCHGKPMHPQVVKRICQQSVN